LNRPLQRARAWGWLVCALIGLLGASPAQAHKPSDSYLRLKVAADAITGQWDIALRDLDFVIGLDADGDGNITWGELRARHADIAAYALARLTIQADGAACRTGATEQVVDNHSDGAYTVLMLRIECAQAPKQLALDYKLFSDIDPQHRGLLQLEAKEGTRAAILGPHAPVQTFELKTPSRLEQVLDYGREGVWHIWIGFDHILFLMSLLLPAVLVWRQGMWRPANRFGEAFWDVFKIVTSFTVAHTITLSLATLGAIELPSRWVESAIAASVVLAALNNVFPLVHGRRWMVAFGFGLIHGFGFASVLADLGLPQQTLLLALVGFNVGVECGQLAIVALFLPLAYAARRTWLYQKLILVLGSLLIVLIALAWFSERAFDLEVLPF
jgi:HupE / UreJ protein